MTLESLNKRIKTTTDLRDIVSTMKMLSSVSIGQYEKALASLNIYRNTIWEGFHGLLQDDLFSYQPKRVKSDHPKTIAILIGTDNGLVGRFNREVLSFAKNDLKERNCLSETTSICVGKRLGVMTESAKIPIAATYSIMNSLKEIASIASMVLIKINELVSQQKIDQVLVYNTYKESGAPQRPVVKQLMPLPFDEIKQLKQQKWEGRGYPLITGNRTEIFSALSHEYLTTVLTHALTASLAAEHYTRMINMQQAEQNIDESLENMNLEYQQLRQTSITDELIDIVSGAESMKKKKKKQNKSL